MARIKPVHESARSRLRGGGSAADPRGAYRDAITSLKNDEILEIWPEGGETLRGLKAIVTRSGKQAAVDVTYGETVDGALLVWRRTVPRRQRRRRNSQDQS